MKKIITGFLYDYKAMDKKLLAVIASASVIELLIWHMRGPVSTPEFARFLWAPYPSFHSEFYTIVNGMLLYYAFYFIFPVLLIILLYKGDFRFFGLGWGNSTGYLPIYIIFFIIVLPFIIAASFQKGFADSYPFMRVDVFYLIVIWEALYFLQFICVEFFFRGFLLFPFCKNFGISGILIPIIPYCLIHLEKPLPEALGSILAGLLLGYLAWKSRSIWGGVLLHGSAALVMDIAALMQR